MPNIVEPSKKVIVIGGLIGAGKTTLAEELAAALGDGTLFLKEPDEKGGKNPYLDNYYGDMCRWSFTMQVHLLGTRFKMQQLAQWHVMNGAGNAVVDRSYYEDTAFAHLQLRMGLMSEREFATYETIYQAMTASVMLPSVFIRTLVTPERCNARIAKRMLTQEGRICENAIDLDYLRGLEVEIEHMVSVLRSQGVTVYDMPWDVDRDGPEARADAIAGLAARIKALKPVDRFLDKHRRAL